MSKCPYKDQQTPEAKERFKIIFESIKEQKEGKQKNEKKEEGAKAPAKKAGEKKKKKKDVIVFESAECLNLCAEKVEKLKKLEKKIKEAEALKKQYAEELKELVKEWNTLKAEASTEITSKCIKCWHCAKYFLPSRSDEHCGGKCAKQAASKKSSTTLGGFKVATYAEVLQKGLQKETQEDKDEDEDEDEDEECDVVVEFTHKDDNDDNDDDDAATGTLGGKDGVGTGSPSGVSTTPDANPANGKGPGQADHQGGNSEEAFFSCASESDNEMGDPARKKNAYGQRKSVKAVESRGFAPKLAAAQKARASQRGAALKEIRDMKESVPLPGVLGDAPPPPGGDDVVIPSSQEMDATDGGIQDSQTVVVEASQGEAHLNC